MEGISIRWLWEFLEPKMIVRVAGWQVAVSIPYSSLSFSWQGLIDWETLGWSIAVRARGPTVPGPLMLSRKGLSTWGRWWGWDCEGRLKMGLDQRVPWARFSSLWCWWGWRRWSVEGRQEDRCLIGMDVDEQRLKKYYEVLTVYLGELPLDANGCESYPSVLFWERGLIWVSRVVTWDKKSGRRRDSEARRKTHTHFGDDKGGL